MKIEKVKIVNFKKHLNVEADFVDGLNTIQGGNYSGKTTVTQAVLWCLFGPSAVLGTAKELANSDSDAQPEVTTYLSDGYKVKRKGNNVSLCLNSVDISRSSSVVALELENLFGLTKEEFLLTRVSKQGEAQSLLAVGSDRIKKVIEKLSGCSILDEVGKELKARKKEEGASLSALSPLLLSREELQRFRESQDLLQQESNSAKATHETLKEHEESAKLEVDRCMEALTQARKHNTRVKAQEDAYQDALRTLQALQQDRQELPTDEGCEEELAGYEVVLEDLKGKLKEHSTLQWVWDAAQKEVEQTNQALSSLKDKVDKSTSLRQRYEKLYSECDVFGLGVKKELTMQEMLDAAADSIAELKTTNSLLKNAACPTCKRPFDKDFDKEEVQEKLRVLEKQVSEQTLSLNHMDDYLNASSNEENATDKLFDAEVSQANAVDKLSQLEEPEDSEKENLESFVEETTLEIGRLSQVKASVERCERRLTKAQAAYDDTPKPEPEIESESLQDELKEAQEDFHQLQKEETTALNQYHEKTLLLNSVTEKLQQHAKVVTQVVPLEEDLKSYNTILKAIKDNRDAIMHSVWVGILQETSTFVSACTEGIMESVAVEEGAITYREDGKVYQITQASGAQKTLISVGMKAALCTLLPNNVGFFIADELTADMEDSVSATAMSLLKSRLGQVINVSHRQLDGAITDNVLEL